MIVAALSVKELEFLEMVDTNPHRKALRKKPKRAGGQEEPHLTVEEISLRYCPVNMRDRWAKAQSVNALTVTGFMHGKDSYKNNKALCEDSIKKLQEYNREGFLTSYGVIFFVLIAIVLDKHAVQLLSGRGGCIHSKPFFCSFCCCRNKDSGLPSVYLCHECDMERKEYPDGISPPGSHHLECSLSLPLHSLSPPLHTTRQILVLLPLNLV
jgi:hypothetical protein